MTVQRAELRPTVLSTVVAVSLATGVIIAIDVVPTVLTALAIQGSGFLVIGVGTTLRRRGYRGTGITLVVAGCCIVAIAVARFISGSGTLSGTLRFLPGLLGLPLIVAALIPIRSRGSRNLVKLGSSGVFLSVVLSRLFLAVGDTQMLLAGMATIVAWSTAENAIGVGKQLGRSATTWRLETVHTVGSTLVGLGGVIAISLVRDIGATGLSLASFTLLFVALLLLVATMHR